MPLISHSTFPSLKVLAGHLPAGSVGAVRSKELVLGEQPFSEAAAHACCARSLRPGLSCGSALRALTITAVSEFSILCNLQFSWVCGGDPITCLHAVPLFQLSKGTH